MKTDASIIFLHIPKTGGSTLHGIINRQHKRGQWFDVVNDRKVSEFAELSDEKKAKIKVLKGHMAFGHHKDFLQPESVKYITMLRDPVERIISNYYFILQLEGHHTHKAIVENNYSIADYVSSGIIANSENAQVRLLSGDNYVQHGECTREMLEQAKEHLDKYFAVVGINKKYDEFLMLLQQYFGWKMPYYASVNVTKKRIKREALTADELTVIRKYNALDTELFEYAEQRFQSQWEEAGLEEQLERFRKKSVWFQKVARLKRKVVG